ncbi:MAG: GNAT family N-acetyltransferase [Planctomycetota bacterium]|jgi:RimJ/RimL family protein N-acetyltransferase
MTQEPPVVETLHVGRDNRSFRIRRARRDDAAAVLRFLTPLFEEPDLPVTYSPGEFAMSVAEEEEFIGSYEESGALLLFALAESDVIGSLGFRAGKVLRTRHAGAFGVSVAKDWRGVGVGSSLIGRLIDWAKEHPVIERIGLEVFAENSEAIRLYRRLGFQEEGRLRAAICMGGRRVDAIPMGLVLPPKRP